MKHTFFKSAFTLVELIVVITILAILGTIGFISLQGYSVNARDSVRIADTKTFIKALNIYQTKEGQVPLPDDMTTITGSGVVFSYQGTLSGSVITALKQGAVPLDPTLNEPYLYATNDTQTKFQLLSYMEKNTSVASLDITSSHAADSYSDYFPRVVGDEVGILLNEDNSPIASGNLDLENDTNIYQNRVSQTISYRSSGSGLFPQSCKQILGKENDVGTGTYSIRDSSGTFFEVYCDMSTDGGGWTLIASTVDGSFFNDCSDVGMKYGTTCESRCEMITGNTRNCTTLELQSIQDSEIYKLQQKYKIQQSYSSLEDKTVTDYISPSYYKTSFVEVMFQDDADDYIVYDYTVSGGGVDYSSMKDYYSTVDTYPLKTLIPATSSSLDPAVINACGNFDLAIVLGDNDGRGVMDYSAMRFNYYSPAFAGPGWDSLGNSRCRFDDPGNASRWIQKRLGGQYNEVSQYLYWFVR